MAFLIFSGGKLKKSNVGLKWVRDIRATFVLNFCVEFSGVDGLGGDNFSPGSGGWWGPDGALV